MVLSFRGRLLALVSLISIRVATSACWCLSGTVHLYLAAAGHCPALHALSACVDLNLSNASILVMQPRIECHWTLQ